MFVRSGKEGSQVAPLTKHLSIRRRACSTTCCRSQEVVVEDIERVPAAAARVARPERSDGRGVQRLAFILTGIRHALHRACHTHRPSTTRPRGPAARAESSAT